MLLYFYYKKTKFFLQWFLLSGKMAVFNAQVVLAGLTSNKY